MNDSDTSKIVLAKWSDRFIAWLIDFIIISSISTAIIFALFGSIDYQYEESIFFHPVKGNFLDGTSTRSIYIYIS